MTKNRHRQAPILRTKLHRPPMPPDVVRRESLLGLLGGGAQTPVTLVSAPAGYGKTVLVSQWLAELNHAEAWLSLDESDSDLDQFLAYLSAGIERRRPGACAEMGSVFTLPELPPVQDIARDLANDLEALDAPLVLVLDDYHNIAPSSPVHELLGQLLEHPPRTLSLVLLTRRDPPLALARLRANAQLIEVRLRDLCFTAEETTELFARGAGVEISPEGLDDLQREIDGWAVGLRLVLAAVRNSGDAEAFIRGLRGGGGLARTQDYLMQEVLSALSPAVRDLLVRSSIFQRFCAEALDALVSPDSEFDERPSAAGAFMTVLLERNLFAIALDEEGRWFRYHPLFRDLLRIELERHHSAEKIRALHRRASEWFEQQGSIGEALDHAVAAGEPLLAADIIERHRIEELNFDRFFVVERWLRRVPEDVIQKRPALLLTRAAVLFDAHRMPEMASVNERVEALLEGAEQGREALLGELDYLRGGVDVWMRCDGAAARRRLEAAKQQLPSQATAMRARVEVYLAVAGLLNGQGESEVARLEEALRQVDPAAVHLRSRFLAGQVIVSLTMGDLRRARRVARRLMAMVGQTESIAMQGWSFYLLGLAELHRLELQPALDHFSVTRRYPQGVNRRLFLDSLAGLVWAHDRLGQEEDAEALLQQLDRETREAEPRLAAIAESCRARRSLLRGEPEAAADWADSFMPFLHPSEMLFLFEVPILTQARVWIELGGGANLSRALDRLEALTAIVTPHHLTAQWIEIEVLRALALEKAERHEEALESLTGAVEVAAPSGWLRPFVEPGPAMAQLLGRLARLGDHEEVLKLQRALDGSPPLGSAPAARTGPAPPGEGRRTRFSATSPEHFTNRELDVLELLVERLRDKEIAARLGISPQTVKGHLKHLYQKLGADGRRSAVTRATSLGLLDPRAE